MNDDLSPELYFEYPPMRPRRRLRLPSLSALALVVLVLAGVGFALVSNLPSTLAAAHASASATASPSGHGFGHGPDGRGAALTVTSVNGSDIVAKDRQGASVTIHTSSSTVIQRAGATAKLSDLTAGTMIDAHGTRNSDGTITADHITIVLPVYAGTVTKISGNSITVQSPRDSSAQIITVSSSTTYTRAGLTASLSDVRVGGSIEAEGTVNSDKSLSAERVEIEVPRVSGQIVSVSGADITLRDPFGGTLTVHTTSSTKVSSVSFGANGPTETSIALSSLKAGDWIEAAGTRNTDDSLLALSVTLMPNAPSGQSNHGGPGFGPGGPGDGLAPAA